MNKLYLITTFLSIFSLNNATAINLKEGLNIVYAENPTLQTFKNELEIKSQDITQARSGFLPSLTAKYSLADQSVNPEVGQDMDSSPSNASIELNQPLFKGGSTLAGFKAAKLNHESSKSDYLLQQQNIFQSATNAYLSVLTTQTVLDFNNSQVATNTEEMKRIEQRFKLGDITLPNLKEFEARLSGYIADRHDASGNVLAAKSNFAAIFGRLPENLSWPKLTTMFPTSIGESVQISKANNPEIAKFKLLLKASEQNVNIARANFMPTVNAVASWSDSSNQYNTTDSSVTSVGIQASLPLFAGGSNKSKYAQRKAQKQQALDTLSQNIRNIEAAAAIAYNDVLVQTDRVKALRVRLLSFAITTDATEKQEQAGEASIIDVLDARDDEFSAKVDLELARQKLVLAKLALLSSLGKFTYSDIDSIFKSATMDEMPSMS